MTPPQTFRWTNARVRVFYRIIGDGAMRFPRTGEMRRVLLSLAFKGYVCDAEDGRTEEALIARPPDYVALTSAGVALWDERERAKAAANAISP